MTAVRTLVSVGALVHFVGAVVGLHLQGRSSDPLVEGVHSLPQYDPSLPQLPMGHLDTLDSDIPGAPLNPDDFKKGNQMVHKDFDPSKKSDPIELAGLFQGDIIIKSADQFNDMVLPADAPRPRNALKNTLKQWNNGVIPYVISSSYSVIERGAIATAMSRYHNNTCIRFVPRTMEKDYIHILKGDGCSSSVGRVGGAQGLSLGPGCLYVGIIMHEFMHAAGFWHEQSRADRDSFVTIVPSNIQTGMEYNFNKYTWDKIQSLGVDYDTASVMHYGPYAFARDRTKPTIIPRNSGVEIGQRRDFSPKDILKLQVMYNCANTSTTIVTDSPISAITKEPCKDYNKFCSTWSAMEECTKNPTWMNVNCKKSCKQCDKECSDNNEHCAFWAGRDECTSNPDYMSRLCKKSCGLCHAEAEFNAAVCEDQNRHCAAWQEAGHCRSNPRYMLVWCRKACGNC